MCRWNCVAFVLCCGPSLWAQPTLPGTEPLSWTGDLASRLVEGADRFLLKKIEAAAAKRDARYQAKPISEQASALRQELRALLGLANVTGVSPPRVELVATPETSSLLAETAGAHIHRVRWNSQASLTARGLLLQPKGEVIASAVLLPDTEQTPEALAQRFGAALADAGCRILIPTLVSRQVRPRRQSELTDREYLHRSAFELGRQLSGYEVQHALAAASWLQRQAPGKPMAVAGWGEGGRQALFAAALTDQFQVACVSGYFGTREGVWQEPLDRNVFRQLACFGDAELAALAAPTKLLIDDVPGPRAEVNTRGGAPYRLAPQAPQQRETEVARAQRFGGQVTLVNGASPASEKGPSTPCLSALADHLGLEAWQDSRAPSAWLPPPDRQQEIVRQIVQHHQRLLVASDAVRREYFRDLKTESVAAHAQSVEDYRERFRREVIGHFDDPRLPPRPRTRLVWDRPQWRGYEVVLDVFPDLFALGVLLVPKDLQDGERRPVVVCQHGLEGRPRDTIEGDHPAYHDFAAKLAERGFITFAPQNLYIFRDRFRTLQRKANPLGKTLFSLMIPQHEQITDWIASLPFVDADRIAFYGLSYGGKSAMRIPPLVPRYCLSICSADFNDWVWKNASTESPYSYVWTGEYEIFEWDLAHTFNYAEMASLIAPRPFMVERGHFDGVAPDERVAYEFAKVRRLYQAQLGIGDRCEIEFFVGPHTIHGQGTFDFLHRHLQWPASSAATTSGQEK